MAGGLRGYPLMREIEKACLSNPDILGSMRPKRALEQVDDVQVAEGEYSVPLIGRSW